jgi:tetratricopeptide (TPR) repeat protein
MDSSTVSSVADSLFSATTLKTSSLQTIANAALQRGITEYQDGNYEKAVDEFARAVGIGRCASSSYASDAAQYLAMSYLQLNQPEEAIEAYQTALQIDQSNDEIRLKIGNIYYSQQKYEEACGQYSEAVRLNPSTTNRYALGQAYIELARFNDAEDQYSAIQRISPDQAGGFLGMGLVYSRSENYEAAIDQFNHAIELDSDLWEAYTQKGYAYADMGDMDKAQAMVYELEGADQTDSADTLSRYMYKVDPPKMVFAQSDSSFSFSMGKSTPLVALDSYLMNANASKNFTMTIQFDKAMDRESIENVGNWQITRAIGEGPGESYNFGLSISPTEVRINSTPISVYWDDDSLTATVYFKIQQNSAANGTIDPSHIEFKFSGYDIYGLSIDSKADQYTGFKGVF